MADVTRFVAELASHGVHLPLQINTKDPYVIAAASGENVMFVDPTSKWPNDKAQSVVTLLKDLINSAAIPADDAVHHATASHAGTVSEATARRIATGVMTLLKKTPADQIICEIEERFPNWRSYRDLVDCIDCTLHDLRHATPIAGKPQYWKHARKHGLDYAVKQLHFLDKGSALGWVREYHPHELNDALAGWADEAPAFSQNIWANLPNCVDEPSNSEAGGGRANG